MDKTHLIYARIDNNVTLLLNLYLFTSFFVKYFLRELPIQKAEITHTKELSFCLNYDFLMPLSFPSNVVNLRKFKYVSKT